MAEEHHWLKRRPLILLLQKCLSLWECKVASGLPLFFVRLSVGTMYAIGVLDVPF